MRQVMTAWCLALAMLAAAGAAEAQTRADSAAVILHTAQQFRARGDEATARVLLEYVQRQYAGTVAAAEADQLMLGVRRGQAMERPGRTELMVWGATYGAWLGVAVPLMADAGGPEAYGVGLLLGAPAGFLAGRAYANAAGVTEGQARAITFGGTWGTWQGFGWGEVLDIGSRRPEWCPPQDTGCEEAHVPTRVAVGVLSGLAGIGTGAYLARRPVTAGTAAAVSSAGLWGTWFGFGAGFIADQEDDALLTTTLLGGNAALVAAALMAPGRDLTESRVRLISAGGLIGGLAGAGLALIFQPDDERVAMAFPVTGSVLGLAAGMHYTRDRVGGSGGAPGGALINHDGGRWALGLPEPGMDVQRRGAAAEPAVYVPLLRARF
ncbi:MAG TPA: hypothetical protein VK929_17435 [Longimicrobiales bacterium]|nr:hypothetical protein [Longimicrobiales bacterium]